MKLLTLFSGVIFLVGIFTISVQAAKPDTGQSFTPFRAAVSHAPGWTEQKDQYRFFTAKDLYGIIDGGAVEHEKQGLKNGIGLSCTKGNNTLDIYFEDFGTVSRAKGMVEVKKKSLSDTKEIPLVTIKPALYEGVIGGCIAYWAKSRYYIEMTLTGYDSLSIAVRDAVTLIDSVSPAIIK
jgi:hypothetical protein